MGLSVNQLIFQEVRRPTGQGWTRRLFLVYALNPSGGPMGAPAVLGDDEGEALFRHVTGQGDGAVGPVFLEGVDVKPDARTRYDHAVKLEPVTVDASTMKYYRGLGDRQAEARDQNQGQGPAFKSASVQIKAEAWKAFGAGR